MEEGRGRVESRKKVVSKKERAGASKSLNLFSSRISAYTRPVPTLFFDCISLLVQTPDHIAHHSTPYIHSTAPCHSPFNPLSNYGFLLPSCVIQHRRHYHNSPPSISLCLPRTSTPETKISFLTSLHPTSTRRRETNLESSEFDRRGSTDRSPMCCVVS